MKERTHKRSDLYRAERENGLTYQEIADKYGVSKQNVQQSCGKQSTAHFRYNNTCVYPVLRKWINDNKVSTSELVRRMGLIAHTSNNNIMMDRLCGRSEWKKHEIDKMIEITGMTYEELFREEDDGQE